MKVRLTFTVDLDPDMWVETYGVDRSEVREDVKSYFRNAIQQSAPAEESNLTIVD